MPGGSAPAGKSHKWSEEQKSSTGGQGVPGTATRLSNQEFLRSLASVGAGAGVTGVAERAGLEAMNSLTISPVVAPLVTPLRMPSPPLKMSLHFTGNRSTTGTLQLEEPRSPRVGHSSAGW